MVKSRVWPLPRIPVTTRIFRSFSRESRTKPLFATGILGRGHTQVLSPLSGGKFGPYICHQVTLGPIHRYAMEAMPRVVEVPLENRALWETVEEMFQFEVLGHFGVSRAPLMWGEFLFVGWETAHGRTPSWIMNAKKRCFFSNWETDIWRS